MRGADRIINFYGLYRVNDLPPPAARPRGRPRSEDTRNKMLQHAEQLFASRGVASVSMNEINQTSGQKNRNAAHYHFGSKAGLLHAVLMPHLEEIYRRRSLLLDALPAQYGLREVVTAFVKPLADLIRESESARNFVLITAQLFAAESLVVLGLERASQVPEPPVQRLVECLRRSLPSMPEPIVQQRLVLAGGLLFHGLADHLRMRETPASATLITDTELFLSNLEDSMIGLLIAPVSAASLALLHKA